MGLPETVCRRFCRFANKWPAPNGLELAQAVVTVEPPTSQPRTQSLQYSGRICLRLADLELRSRQLYWEISTRAFTSTERSSGIHEQYQMQPLLFRRLANLHRLLSNGRSRLGDKLALHRRGQSRGGGWPHFLGRYHDRQIRRLRSPSHPQWA